MTTHPSITTKNIPLAPYTTLKLGGCADYFCHCESTSAIKASLQFAAEKGLNTAILGGGSNTIISDQGFAGLVIHINTQYMQFEKVDDNTMLVTVAAGVNWDDFVQACIKRGLVGVECLSGIPGKVGATPIQNVGAYGQEVKNTIVQVKAIDKRTLVEVNFSQQDCQFSYRNSRFKQQDAHRYIITEVQFTLAIHGQVSTVYPDLQKQLQQQGLAFDYPASPEQLLAIRNTVLAIRRRKSMVLDTADPNSQSVGSFFTNPIISQQAFSKLQANCHTPIPHFPHEKKIKMPAAWLIEQAGFQKGYRYRGVGISKNHALALINIDGSTQELLTLATMIEQKVADRFAIQLQREPVVLG